MAYTGSVTAGNEDPQGPLNSTTNPFTPKVMGRKLFMRKNPGAPGKLGKSTTKAESLSKLRGKGALA